MLIRFAPLPSRAGLIPGVPVDHRESKCVAAHRGQRSSVSSSWRPRVLLQIGLRSLAAAVQTLVVNALLNHSPRTEKPRVAPKTSGGNRISTRAHYRQFTSCGRTRARGISQTTAGYERGRASRPRSATSASLIHHATSSTLAVISIRPVLTSMLPISMTSRTSTSSHARVGSPAG